MKAIWNRNVRSTHAKSDPHNIATFNALLSSLRKSNSDWTWLGKVYKAILGHKDAVRVASVPGDTAVRSEDGKCIVAVSYRPSRSGEPFNKLTLVFNPAGGDNSAMLEEASRKAVPGHRS